MTCREAVLLSEQIDSLSVPKKWRVKLHVFACRGCRNYLKFGRLIKEQIHSRVRSLNEKLIETFTKPGK